MKERCMPRQGTSSRLRQDSDRRQAGGEPDAPEPALDTADLDSEAVVPPASNEAIAVDQRQEPDFPPLRTAHTGKAGGGVQQVVLIAILGMAIGFAVVMLI
jgi:hypothetical protein